MVYDGHILTMLNTTNQARPTVTEANGFWCEDSNAWRRVRWRGKATREMLDELAQSYGFTSFGALQRELGALELTEERKADYAVWLVKNGTKAGLDALKASWSVK
jgi:hypothetical protein